MRVFLPLLLLCLLSVSLPADAAMPDPAESAISLSNFLRHQLVERFQNFRGRVKIGQVSPQDGIFLVEGLLTAENGLPMDLLAQFLEAMDGTGYFPVVIPARVSRVDVDDPQRISFQLRVQADLKRIPEDLTRESGFRFVVPAERLAPTEVQVSLSDAAGERELERRVCRPGEALDLKFRCEGKAVLSIRLDGVPFKEFALP